MIGRGGHTNRDVAFAALKQRRDWFVKQFGDQSFGGFGHFLKMIAAIFIEPDEQKMVKDFFADGKFHRYDRMINQGFETAKMTKSMVMRDGPDLKKFLESDVSTNAGQ